MTLFALGRTGTLGSRLDSDILSINNRLEDFDKITLGSEYLDSTVIHLAGVVGIQNVKCNPSESFYLNVDCAVNFGLACISAGVRKFIYISSGHVYGSSSEPFNENDLMNPQSIYAEQKCIAEERLSRIFEGTNTELTILRVFSVINLSKSDQSLGGLLSLLCKGQSNRKIQNADDVRDFLWASDVGRIISHAAKKNIPSGVFNLCSSQPMSVRELSEKVLNLYGIDSKDCILPGNSTLISNFGDNRKLETLFPFLPLKFTLRADKLVE